MAVAEIHDDALDATLAYIRDNCSHVYLVKGYTLGQAWGSLQIMGTGAIGSTGTHWAAIEDSGNNRRIQFLGEDVTISGTHAGPHDTDVLIVDQGNTKVLCSTDETNNIIVSDAEVVAIPGFYIYNLAATQV